MPALVVTGMLYGDEGKGTIVDYLVREHDADGVVKFTSGAQQAHNVVVSDKVGQLKQHTFRQFGAGTFHGVATHLSRYFLVNPYMLFAEKARLDFVLGSSDQKLWNLLSISPEAQITTPFHVAANRLRERCRDSPHGSCGMGIGETASDGELGLALTMADLRDLSITELRTALHQIRHRKKNELQESFSSYRLLSPEYAGLDEWKTIFNDSHATELIIEFVSFCKRLVELVEIRVDCFLSDKTWVFEGAQGILLDQDYGFAPHTTWARTTPYNAHELLKDYKGKITTYGVLRTYMTRHGAGPFVTEHRQPEYTSRASPFFERHNNDTGVQGVWRHGWLDLVALRYALRCAPQIDSLVLTHADRVEHEGAQNWYACTSYAYDSEVLEDIGQQLPRNLLEQKRLTEMLRFCKPKLLAMHPSIDNVVNLIQNETEYPVTMLSFGPTQTDKVQI